MACNEVYEYGHEKRDVGGRFPSWGGSVDRVEKSWLKRCLKKSLFELMMIYIFCLV